MTIAVSLWQMSHRLWDLSSLSILQGGLYSIPFTRWLNHWDCHPNSLLMHCIPCALLDHGTHDPLLGILKQFLLLAPNTSQFLVQPLVLAGCLLMLLPIWYLHIISGIFVPIIYPWYPRVVGWVSTQPCILYSLDILQSSSSWDCPSLRLINHFLCLILRV